MGNPVVSRWIFGLQIWPLLVMLVPSITLFRRHGREVIRKQVASLIHAGTVFLITATAGIVSMLDASDLFLFLAVAAIATALVVFRRYAFPYRLTCPECGHRHNLLSAEIQNIYVMDDNLCYSCRERLNPKADGEDDDLDDEDDSEDEDDSDDE